MSAASSAEFEPQLLDLRVVFYAIEIDMPHWRVQLLVRLDDRKARTGNVALMAERRDESARERRLADSLAAPKALDHIPCSRHPCERSAKAGRSLDILKDHREPRGIVSVTTLPSRAWNRARLSSRARLDELAGKAASLTRARPHRESRSR